MSNVIKLKRGTSTPSTSDIASGEVAIDTSAQKLYINDSGTIKEVGGGGTPTSVANPSGEVDITASAIVDINAGSSLDIDAATAGTIDTGNALSLTSGHATNITSGHAMELTPGHAFIINGGASTGYPFKTKFQQYELYHNDGSNRMGFLSYTGGNVGYGYQTLQDISNLHAGNETAVGFQAGKSITSGADNSLYGAYAGDAITTGKENVAIGSAALSSLTDQDSCVAIGYETGTKTTGAKNTLLGSEACKELTSGTNNVGIGWKTGDTLTTGDNNIVIGATAEPSSATVDNEITLGNTSITKFRIPGLNFSLKDTTATEDYVLTVDSNGDAGWEAAPADSTKLPLAGGTLTGATKLNDNIQLQFGSDTDYFIKHDGSNCWHKCTTGNLELKTYGASAGNINFESAGGSTFKVNENTTALTLASNGNATFGEDVIFTGDAANLTWDKSTDDLIFNDNAKAIFGTSSDGLEIHHDGSNSFIDETGTGILYIRSSSTIRLSDISGNNMILCEDGGETQLFHNGTEKLNTSSGGVTVSGTCTATAFSGDGSALTNISAGKVGQVVSTTKTNTFSISATMNGSAGFSDITGMSVTITPSSSSSKVMVWAISRVGAPNHANVRLVRGSTAIAVGDTDGSRTRTGTGECYNLGNSYRSMDSTIMYLDSPSTTSATTYKLQIACASTSYFNRTVYDDNHLVGVRPASTITVMEILS